MAKGSASPRLLSSFGEAELAKQNWEPCPGPGAERGGERCGTVRKAGLVAPEVWVEMGSTESVACLSSTAAPWTSLPAAATSIAFQGPGTSKASSRATIISLPLAVSCPRQIPALPMLLADPAQRWCFIPAAYLLDVFPVLTNPGSLSLKGQCVLQT